MATALQEDVAVVGLSILSGAHLGLTARVIEGLRAADADDIAVVVGGTIPAADVPRLRAAGAAAVYPTGTPLDVLVPEIRALAAAQPSQHEPSQHEPSQHEPSQHEPSQHEEAPCASA